MTYVLAVLEILQLAGAMAISLFLAVHGLYYLLVLRGDRVRRYAELMKRLSNEPISYNELPYVSVVMPVYNEEQTISRKLQEIAQLAYPRERIEVVLINDCSTDRTVHVARRILDDLPLRSRILSNVQRMGPNACYNVGVRESNGDLVFTTDADVTVSSSALMKAVSVLLHFEVGGVTAKAVSVPQGEEAAFAIEKSYRGMFQQMFAAESAIHSTFPGYTACMVFRRPIFSPMATGYGSSDGNISLMIIRKRLKFIYVPEMLFYEPISGGFTEQKARKVRRATRLIQSTLRNRDMFFNGRYGDFGRLVFPLRFGMMIVCPPALLLGSICVVLAIMLMSLSLGLLIVSAFSCIAYLAISGAVDELEFFGAFLAHEFYMLLGLLGSPRRRAVWSKDGKNI